METILDHPQAVVRITGGGGRLTVTVEPKVGVVVAIRHCETGYPLDLIEHVLRVKGPSFLCDEILRDEDPIYVQNALHWDILSFAPREHFVGRRLLDFGAGSGASSMVLARMFLQTEIVGADLVPEFLELARHRAVFYGVSDRVSFSCSLAADRLPPDIGSFDHIVFSAVYEHLLPAERQIMLPLLWAHLKPGGILFLDQTPYRWFPVESHTTGLPLLNYLPDGLALACARRFSRRIKPDISWPQLLRKGVRGGTVGEILWILNRDGRTAELLAPSQLGVCDHIDLWYRRSSSVRRPLAKKVAHAGFRAAKALTGATILPTLSLALRKAV